MKLTIQRGKASHQIPHFMVEKELSLIKQKKKKEVIKSLL
jgi:hypothetical protein